MAEQKDRVSEVKETKAKDKPQSKKEKKKDRKARGFFKDMIAETKKVTWYSKADTLKNSALVITIIVVCSAVLGLLDWGLRSLIALLGNIA